MKMPYWGPDLTEDAIEAALASLKPADREVLELRDVQGLTAPEVAAMLGVGVAAVKSRLHRARIAVREFEAGRAVSAEQAVPVYIRDKVALKSHERTT